jgi:hypothetical protein
MVRDKSIGDLFPPTYPYKGRYIPFILQLVKGNLLIVSKKTFPLYFTYIYNDCKSVSFSVVVMMNVDAFVSVKTEIRVTFRALFCLFGTEIDYTTCRTSWFEKANECDNHLVYINVAFVTANVLS